MVACLEEIAYRMGYITAADLDASGASDGVERVRPVPAPRARARGLTCASSPPRSPASSSSSPTCTATTAASSSRPTTRRSTAAGGIDGPFVQDNHSRSIARHAARPAPPAPPAAGQADPRHRGRDLRRRRRRAARVADLRPLGRRRRCRPRTSGSATCRPASRTASASSSAVAQVEYKCTELYDPASEIGIAWNDPALGHRVAGRPPYSLRARPPPSDRSRASSHRLPAWSGDPAPPTEL